jgi:hypothetical protein
MRTFLKVSGSIAALLFCSLALGKTHYTVTALPDPAFAWKSLTSDGRVLGFDWVTGNALLWSANTGTTLLPAPGGAAWDRVSVSPGGRFLGSVTYPDYTEQSYQGMLDAGLSAVIWPTGNIFPGGNTSGGWTDGVIICRDSCIFPEPAPIYVPREPRYRADAINDTGTLVGTVSIDRSNTGTIAMPENRAVRFSAQGQLEFTPDIQRALAINAPGDALLTPGGIFFLYGHVEALTLWTADGRFFNVDPPPLYPNLDYYAVLNDHGQVAGTAIQSSAPSSQPERMIGFVWTPDTGSISLKGISGYPGVRITGINNSRQVVGYVYSKTLCQICIKGSNLMRATLWTSQGNTVDLNNAVKKRRNASGLEFLLQAQAINDAGQILAIGDDASGNLHSYLLSPAQ